MKKLWLALLGAIIFLLFFSRALIIEVKPRSVLLFEDDRYSNCHLKIEIKEWTDISGNHVNFTLSNKTYELNGAVGDCLCLPEGVLLIAGYPGDPYAPGTELLFLDYSLGKRWEMYISKPVWFNSYQNGKIILSNGCVYWINVVNGSSRIFCLDYGTVTDVEEDGSLVYVATSKGYVYLLENHKPRRGVRVTKPWNGENLRALVRIGIREKYVAVVYSFVRPSGDEKRGFCVYTKNLIKLACKRLSYTPGDVKVIGNTVYVKDFYTKRVRAYRIYSLL